MAYQRLALSPDESDTDITFTNEGVHPVLGLGAKEIASDFSGGPPATILGISERSSQDSPSRWTLAKQETLEPGNTVTLENAVRTVSLRQEQTWGRHRGSLQPETEAQARPPGIDLGTREYFLKEIPDNNYRSLRMPCSKL